MKCRIKKKSALDEMEEYDITRVLVMRTLQDEEEKKAELEENMKNLHFKLTYKRNTGACLEGQEEKNLFKRIFNSHYKGLKITEMETAKESRGRSHSYHTSMHTSKTVKYIKLLQNHKIDEKI